MPDPEIGRPDKHCSCSHGAMVKAKDRNQTIYKSAHHYKSRYIFKGIYNANELYIYIYVYIYIAHQAPLSMEFFRQESWSGLLFLRKSLRDFLTQGSNPVSHIAGRFFTVLATGRG